MMFLENTQVKEYLLEEVVEIQCGIGPAAHEYRDEGEPILKVKNIQDGKVTTDNLDFGNFDAYSNAKTVKPGDVVIVKEGGSTGKIGVNETNMEFIFILNMFKLEPNHEILDRKYLYYYLLNSKKEIEKITIPGHYPRLKREALGKLKIAIPDLETQRKITKTLDKFDEIEREIDLREKQYRYYREFLIRS